MATHLIHFFKIPSAAAFWCLLILYWPLSAVAQAPDTLWLERYGGVQWEEFEAVAVAADGGYLAAGTAAMSSAYEDWNAWVVKTDTAGVILWNRTYGGLRRDMGLDLLALPDGGCLMSGSSDPDTMNRSGGLLLRLDANGDSLWSRVYEQFAAAGFNAIIPTQDGGYAMCGYIEGTQFWLFKVDENGDSLWERRIGGPGWDVGFDLLETPNGNLMAMGRTESYGHGYSDLWLYCASSEGDSLWSQTYGGAGYDTGHDVVMTADGGFALSGYTMSFGEGYTNGYVVKTDPQGNFQWQRVFGDGYMGIESLLALPDGSVLCGGGGNSLDTDHPYLWLTRLASNGDSLWGRIWPTASSSYIQDIQLLPMNRYLITGVYNYQSVYSGGDGFLAVIEPDTFTVAAHPEIYLPEEFSLSAYPNPFNAQTEIRYTLSHTSPVSLRVFDLLGREVALLDEGRHEAGKHRVRWNAEGFSSGVYFCRIEAGGESRMVKMVLLK